MAKFPPNTVWNVNYPAVANYPTWQTAGALTWATVGGNWNTGVQVTGTNDNFKPVAKMTTTFTEVA